MARAVGKDDAPDTARPGRYGFDERGWGTK